MNKTISARIAGLLAAASIVMFLNAAPANAADAQTVTIKGVVYSLDGTGGAYVVTRTGVVPANLTIESQVTIGGKNYAVKSIGYTAFFRDKNLVSVTIPDSVTLIDNGAFSTMDNLTTVVIGNGVKKINDGAFYDNPKLAAVQLGNAVKSIGNGAFSDDPSLTSITIPATVTSVLDYAFAYDPALKTVNFLGAVPFMDHFIFFGENPTIYFPARFGSAYVAKGYTTPNWYGLNSVAVEAVLSLTPTPTISGTAVVGRTLTAKPGAWDSGVALRYKWYRSGAAISGATSASYSLVAADYGKSMTVTVTGAKNGFKTHSKTSVATAKVSR